jgi:hypothetical protein
MSLGEFMVEARHLGLARSLARSAYYRMSRVSGLQLYRFLVMEPKDVNRELLTRSVPYECRILSDREVQELSRDPDNGMSDRFASTTCEKGDTCFGILDGGVLASYGFYSRVPTSVLKTLRIHFDSRYLYMYQGYTRPAYRGQNLHGIGLARACVALCARGHAGIVTVAQRFNFASLVSAHRTGYRDCGTAVVIGKGARMRIWQTRAPRQYALRLEPLIVADPEEDT